MENKIQVFGSGCPSCKKLYELVKDVVAEVSPNSEVEYITDIQKIIELGVMSSPVLVINGKPVLSGSVPDKERIRELISNKAFINSEDDKSDKNGGCCSCGGKC